jgi:L-ribulose-5-phosphate 3-epimerase
MNDRRKFLKTLAAVAAAGSTAGLEVTRLDAQQRPAAAPATSVTGIKKSALINQLPRQLSYAERFAMARTAGFEGIEMQTITRPEEAAEIKEASQKTGLRIHSVMNSAHWRSPMSSADPAVLKASVEGMETSLKNAALWGADAVLLVPGVVDPANPYKDVWTRSQRAIRERLLPMAKDLKVVIAIEEVWNKFLLSPIEFARYVDDFDSPFVKAYFDVGNVVLFAYPQDWIRTLGARIVKVHLKDFKLEKSTYSWKNIGEGDIDWIECRKALGEINYNGYVTTEVNGGDAAYLADLAGRVDKFLAGQKPFEPAAKPTV